MSIVGGLYDLYEQASQVPREGPLRLPSGCAGDISLCAKRYLALRDLKSAVDALSKGDLRKNVEASMLDLLKAMLDNDVDRISVKGRTLSPKENFQAKALVEDRSKVSQALKDSGLQDLVFEQYNLRSVASHFKEMYEDGEELTSDLNELLPGPLKDVLELKEFFTISVRKG